MDKEREDKVLTAIEGLNFKGYSWKGIKLVSGANTITGNFYGLAVGADKPTSLKIKIDSETSVMLNGVALTESDDIINFLNEGEFVPIDFTEITIEGAGFVKCFNK